ncbi:hypothetical protein JTE90_015169 [Oedothorax gibbosus]|uniref:Peptidase metallopeptidase domain-containing protein n=1 Tax=Oedothorax gibbosus TaxID=931172 RepID=A0AAV6V9B9_9ARAC|nr:hypothetical protein JTE90_015169 [Oedothorax gibbosus]
MIVEKPGLPFCYLTLVLVLLSHAEASVNKDSRDLVRHWEPVQSYLTQYGYLTPSPQGGGYLRTEDKLREAVARMQKFGGIPQTGVVDDRTLELLRRPRCGMPDLSPSDRVRRYAVQGQKWTKKDLTWRIKHFPRTLPHHLVRAEVQKAFKVWSDVSLLTFTETQGATADIVVSFEHGNHGDGYAFDGRGMVLAHAFFPGEGIGGDAHFDAEEPWSEKEESGIDSVRLFAVAAHEFGHSLGLSHSSVTGALMNPFYQYIQDNFQLPHDDTVAIRMLYGSRNPPRFVPLSPYIPPSTRAPGRSPPPRRPASGAPPTHPKDPGQPLKPQTCNTTFDAITVIRRQLYIFKGKYFWRKDDKGLMQNYPVEINRFFYGGEFEVVDAVYERSDDTKIVFFSGPEYWLFEGNYKVPGYPRPLTDLGLPPDLKRIDAAMVWGYNGKTYLFAGDQYWRYDEREGRVELDYPRHMGMWRGVPTNIDAAFQNTDGITYFFKDKKFWQFNDFHMRVEKNKTRNANELWLGCPSRTEEPPDTNDEDIEESSFKTYISKAGLPLLGSNFLTIASFIGTLLFSRVKVSVYL